MGAYMSLGFLFRFSSIFIVFSKCMNMQHIRNY